VDNTNPATPRRQFIKSIPLLILPLVLGGFYFTTNYLRDSVRKVTRKRKHLVGDIGTLFLQSNVVYTLVENRRIALIRTNDSNSNQPIYKALDTECSHTKCSVHFSKVSQTFLCPCHGGEFSLEGTVLKRPPTKPLKQLTTRVKGNELWIVIGR
jgi:Rieske Fe-S protein